MPRRRCVSLPLSSPLSRALCSAAFSSEDSTLPAGSPLRRGAAFGVDSSFASRSRCSGEQYLRHLFRIVRLGIQNAMVSTYSGAVVRTTHLSGMFTDLGIYSAHSLSRSAGGRLAVCVSAFSSSRVSCGGVAGAVAFRHLSHSTLFIPGGLTFATALTYALYRIRNRRSVLTKPVGRLRRESQSRSETTSTFAPASRRATKGRRIAALAADGFENVDSRCAGSICQGLTAFVIGQNLIGDCDARECASRCVAACDGGGIYTK